MSYGEGPIRFQPMSPVMKAIVVANGVVFLVSMIVGGQFDAMFGLVPQRVIHERWVWQPFTYLFLHGGAIHTLFNLMWLWMFGTFVEEKWGSREFLKYFLLTGVCAGLLCVALFPGARFPIVGFSAVIYGLLVAYSLHDPEMHQAYFFFSMKTKYLAALFGLIEFLVDPNPLPVRLALLSGAGIGYFYIRWWWVVKLNVRSRWAEVSERSLRPAPPKARRRASTGARAADARDDETAEVDRILDKILAQGEGSLTEREREVLRRQARKQRGEGSA